MPQIPHIPILLLIRLASLASEKVVKRPPVHRSNFSFVFEGEARNESLFHEPKLGEVGAVSL